MKYVNQQAASVAAGNVNAQNPGSNTSHTSSGLGQSESSKRVNASNGTSGKGDTTSSNVSPGSGSCPVNVDSGDSCESTSPKVSFFLLV